MAEFSISTTTPGKLHGLTPEIGMLTAWEHWQHTRTKCFYSAARPAKLAFAGGRQWKTVVFVLWGSRGLCVWGGCLLPVSPALSSCAAGTRGVRSDAWDGTWQRWRPPPSPRAAPMRAGDGMPAVAYGAAARIKSLSH